MIIIAYLYFEYETNFQNKYIKIIDIIDSKDNIKPKSASFLTYVNITIHITTSSTVFQNANHVNK